MKKTCPLMVNFHPPLRGGDGGTGGVQFLGLYTPVLFY